MLEILATHKAGVIQDVKLYWFKASTMSRILTEHEVQAQ